MKRENQINAKYEEDRSGKYNSGKQHLKTKNITKPILKKEALGNDGSDKETFEKGKL